MSQPCFWVFAIPRSRVPVDDGGIGIFRAGTGTPIIRIKQGMPALAPQGGSSDTTPSAAATDAPALPVVTAVTAKDPESLEVFMLETGVFADVEQARLYLIEDNEGAYLNGLCANCTLYAIEAG